jgi:single-stranded-DNA-specific exonuclease
MTDTHHHWVVKPGGLRAARSLTALRSRLLTQRGLGATDTAFFAPVYERDVHSPHELYSMTEAVDRIAYALRRNERILVYGDYDTDGLAGTALLVGVLRQLGGIVMPFLPHRFDDGYGLNGDVLTGLHTEFDLLLTVDCGIANATEVEWLRQQEKDVIIVDHHELPEDGQLPAGRAVLHPRHPAGNYPFKYLSGAGVAWKLCHALLEHAGPTRHATATERTLLDLALLGTVADMVPMIGENRVITRFGLDELKRTTRPGLQLLIRDARVAPEQLTAETLSWRVIPRLNAAGKMDHAQPALELLLTTDREAAARYLAQLHVYNRERQHATTRVLAEAEAVIDPQAVFLFAANPAWPAGVVGLAAGRLAEKYGRPAIVVGGNGRQAVGSARSPLGHNVLSILRGGQHEALKMGGHARAAGFSVALDKVDNFREALFAAYTHAGPPQPLTERMADTVIDAALIGWETLHLQNQFAPFGEENKKPVFITRNVSLVDWRPVGKEGSHAKCTFLVGDRVVDGIGFGVAARMPRRAEIVDILFGLSVNEYRGREGLQIELFDVALPDAVILKEYEESHSP